MMLEEWTAALPSAAQSLVRGGYLAVQTFFILSGFVLARSYANASWTRQDIVRYGAARLARIYPVYLFSLAVVAPFIVDVMLKPGRNAAGKAGLLLNYGFVLQGWTGTLGVGWNTPAWSLSCEFFFYLLFPFFLYWLRDASKRRLAGMVAAALIVPVLLAHAGVPWQWKPVHHLADFVAGIAAARALDFARPKLSRRGYWLYIPAVIAGALAIVYPGIMDGTYGDLNTALRPLNAAVLLGLALGGGVAARLLSTPIAGYLGKASYSMYILHVPILWWYGKWAMDGPLHMPRIVAALLYLAIVMAASALAFELIETPANKWIRDWVSAQFRRQPMMAIRAAA